MRYATPIYIVEEEQVYNAATGDYDIETTETKTYASVVGTSVEVMHLVYGALRQGSLTITTQNRIEFEQVRIGDKHYALDYADPKAVKGSYVVSEIHGHNG